MAAPYGTKTRLPSKVPGEKTDYRKVGSMTSKGDFSNRKTTSKNPEQSKKSEYLWELNQLEKQICAIEREKGTHLYAKRSDFRKDYSSLEEYEMKMVSERKNEKTRLQQTLAKLRNQVDKFQSELQNVKPTPEFVEKLKELMESIEFSLNEFKEQQRKVYEQLMKEEHTTSLEVSELDKHFDMWAQLPPVSIPDDKPTKKSASQLTNKKSILADMPEEVAAFERFLQQMGGHRGGWDEYDHGTFMRLRNKHKGRPIFLDEAASSLPGKSITDVKDHEAWYQEYTALMEKKKEAIQKWRLVKDAKKDELLEQADQHDQDEAAVREKKEAARAKKIEEERQERLTRLSAWKVQKELEKAQAEEKKLREEQKQWRKMEQERQRQMEVKAKVEEMREKRRKEEERLALEAQERLEFEEEEKRQMSKHEMLRFRERDRRKQEEQLLREKEKEAEERQRIKKLERLKGQVEVKVKRDPNRLYKLTKGLEERKKAEKSAANGPSLYIPHRAVPSWRAGVS